MFSDKEWNSICDLVKNNSKPEWITDNVIHLAKSGLIIKRDGSVALDASDYKWKLIAENLTSVEIKTLIKIVEK